ncbi:hypothetical protein AQPW35_01780 [Rubrivivax pictus]|uniref:histidine kinase n=1 Tax=Pseudaquabacterium pictum TaxID=2315236 RepID=A0A480AL20_9BURK|nr:hypothetical protein AQPW35_01780 [Rubrivivax pictus]
MRLRAGRLRAVRWQGRDRAIRVHDLFEGHPQPMWYYDPQTLAFLQVNDAAVRLYGYSQAEFLQMQVPDLRHPAERADLVERLRQRAPGASVVHCTRHRCKTGGWLDIQISAKEARYGGRTAILVLAVDISAQVAAQQALQRQEQQFRALHASLSEVLWLATPDGRALLYLSPAFEQVYGLAAEDFRRDPSLWLAHVHADDRSAAHRSGQQLFSSGSAEMQYRICRADGELRWISDRRTLVRDEQGEVAMIAGIAEDITARRVDQDTLRRNSQELADRYAELARFNRAAVDREMDMIALKAQINLLSQAQQLPPPYRLAFAATPGDQVAVP